MNGLVSISFRALSPELIISNVRSVGLDAVEWGGDVHVPAGDAAAAERVRAMTVQAGLAIPEYGSYYRIGFDKPEAFVGVTASARALNTPIIRLWAGKVGRDKMDDEKYQSCVSDARRVCGLADDFTLCLECHPNTLTEHYDSALRFLEDVGCENLQMFWQPNPFRDLDYNLAAIRALLPRIYSVHTFSWRGREKLPLAAMEREWLAYMELLDRSERRLNYMLEFMHDGRIESLREAAETLLRLREGRP